MAVAYEAVTNTSRLAEVWTRECAALVTQGWASTEDCKNINTAVLTSKNGWYFKRPAALALRLGICPEVRRRSRASLGGS